jgi:hypothetical protein
MEDIDNLGNKSNLEGEIEFILLTTQATYQT